MSVTTDATELRIRPRPFAVEDIYAVVDKLIDNEAVTWAAAEYSRTEGARPAVEAYRKQIGRLGAGRAFRVKRKAAR